jgi:hypothetical protein
LGVGAQSGFAPLLALPEPITLAVHLQDVNVVREPIKQSAGEPLRSEHARPFVKGKIAGQDHRAALVTLAEDLEQKLRPGRRQRNIAQLVDNQQLVAGQLLLKA